MRMWGFSEDDGDLGKAHAERPGELCDSPTFLNINQRVLPPQHIVVELLSDHSTACQPYVHYVQHRTSPGNMQDWEM